MSKGRISVAVPSGGGEASLGKRAGGVRGKKASSGAESGASSSEELSESEVDFENDEMDLDGVSSDDESVASDGGSQEEGEDDYDDDENLPKLKKRKTKAADDGAASFSSAVTAILGSKLKSYDRKDPILARQKQVIKKQENDKLEAKAKRALALEKKKVYDKDRIRDLLPTGENARQVLEKEQQMKKIAQRGVIRLFNVVMSTQNKTQKEVSGKKLLNEGQREKLITEVSKEKFFDLVKHAGSDDE